MKAFATNEETPFPRPPCMICGRAQGARHHIYRIFPWICDACLPHLDEAEVLCAAIEQAHRAILGEDPA